MNDRAFDIQLNTTDAAIVLDVRGEVDMHSSPKLRATLLDVVQKHKPPPTKLIVDLTHASYVDSSGVGTLVEAKRRADRAGLRLILCGLQARVRSVFEITQLSTFFTIVDALDEALSA